MLLKISYDTKERNYIGKAKAVYTHVRREAELEPVKIHRTRCGRGAAENRYYYIGYFKAPEDANFVVGDGLIAANIFRKINRHFNPKKIDWVGDIGTVPAEK